MIESKAIEFENYVAGLIEKTGVPGIGVGISVEGNLRYFKGFGLCDIEKNWPVTENTVFGLASVTKSFTALAINLLAEEKKLSLFHPVKRYLPEFNLPEEGRAENITIHNFLSHTSGIPPLPTLGYVNELSVTVDEYLKDSMALRNKPDNSLPGKPAIRTNKDLLRFMANHDFALLGKPGRYVSYSNDCYSLLGEIIERVSGISFEDYLKRHVWSPLGMGHTFVDVSSLSDFQVQGLYYRDDSDNLIKAPWKHRETFVSSGSMKSSVKDLLKYMEVYLEKGTVNGNRICQAVTADRMTAPYYPLEDGAYYAYGLQVRPEYTDGATLVCHGGNIVGVASYIGFVPEKKIAVAVLTNLSGFPASRVFYSAVNLALGLPCEYQKLQMPAANIPAKHLKKFVGRYTSGEGAEIRFVLDGENLVALLPKKGKETQCPVRATGYDSLCIDEDGEDTNVFFLFTPEGNVWAMRHGLRLIRKVD